MLERDTRIPLIGVLLLAAALTACSVFPRRPPLPEARTYIEVLPGAEGGNHQHEQSGTRLPRPLQVRALGTDGIVRPGMKITFRVEGSTSTAMFSHPDTRTDGKGIARTYKDLERAIGTQHNVAYCADCTGIEVPEMGSSGSNASSGNQVIPKDPERPGIKDATAPAKGLSLVGDYGHLEFAARNMECGTEVIRAARLEISTRPAWLLIDEASILGPFDVRPGEVVTLRFTYRIGPGLTRDNASMGVAIKLQTEGYDHCNATRSCRLGTQTGLASYRLTCRDGVGNLVRDDSEGDQAPPASGLHFDPSPVWGAGGLPHISTSTRVYVTVSDTEAEDAYASGVASVSIALAGGGATEFDWRPFSLSTGSHLVSLSAMDRYGNVEPPHSVRVIVDAAASQSPPIGSALPADGLRRGSFGDRYREATALSNAGADSVPALLATLREQDPLARQLAAYALGRIGPAAPDAIAALIGAFADSNQGVGWIASESATLSGLPAAPLLMQALLDPRMEVRRNASRALARMRPRVLPIVAHFLRDPNPQTRRQAALVFEDPATVPGALFSDYVDVLVEAAMDHSSESRGSAWAALGGLPNPSPELLERLLPAFHPDDLEALDSAVETVAEWAERLRDADSQPQGCALWAERLMAVATSSAPLRIRLRAAVAAFDLDRSRSEALRIVREGVLSSGWDDRRYASRQVIRIGPEAIAVLISDLELPAGDGLFAQLVEGRPIAALVLKTGPWSYPVLERALNDRSIAPEARARLPEILVSISSSSARTARALSGAMLQRSSHVVVAALSAARRTSGDVQEWLMPDILRLAGQGGEVREAAVETLESMWDVALPHLERAQSAKMPGLRALLADVVARRAMWDCGSTQPANRLRCSQLVAAHLEHLLGQLRDRDFGVRLAAAHALHSLDPNGETSGQWLAESLRSSDSHVRVAAAFVLAASSTSRTDASRAAFPGLSSKDPRERRKVAELFYRLSALEKLEPSLIPEIAQAAKFHDPDVTGALIAAISRSTHPVVLPTLDAALRHRNPRLRRQAIFGFSAAKEAAQAVDRVAPSLRDPDPQVQLEAARALGRLLPKAPSAVGPLTDTLSAEDMRIAREAAVALAEAKVSDSRVIARLLDVIESTGTMDWWAYSAARKADPENPHLRMALLSYASGSASRTHEVIQILLGLGPPGRKELFRLLARWQDVRLYETASSALEKQGPPSTEELAQLLNALPERRDYPYCSYAESWLIRSSATIAGALMELFPHVALQGRGCVISTLAEMKSPRPEIIEFFRMALRDSEPWVRGVAAGGLAGAGPAASESVPDLIEAYVNAEGSERQSVAYALSRVAGPKELAPFLLFLLDSGLDSWALRRVKPLPPAVESFLIATLEGDKKRPFDAVAELRALGTPKARDALRSAGIDPTEEP